MPLPGKEDGEWSECHQCRFAACSPRLPRSRQPPVSPASPPGLPPLSRTEILARYRRLRQISKEQHEAVLDIIAPDVLLDWAKRLDLTKSKAVVLENDNEMTLPEDLAIYLPRLGHAHPLDRYARGARFAPNSDEAIVLAAMRRARFPCGASSGGTRARA